MKLTNNKVAFLAIMLMLISLICNALIYQKAGIQITGKAANNGYVVICVNHPPRLNAFLSNLTVKENSILTYDVNATDPNNATQNLTFYDNTTLFNISPSTGIINFTAPGNSADLYYILITVSDNSTCANSNATQTLIINITMENIAPLITSHYPLGNPAITEEQTRLFNISYYDEDEDTLAVYWYLDNSLVSVFNDLSSILSSNYTFTGNYTNAGIYDVLAIVSDGRLNDSYSWILTVTNVNRAPGFNRIIKNQTWAEDSILFGLDLDDYSYDQDQEDTLEYSINYLTNPHKIIITINDDNVVTFSPPANWYGSENISFTVKDNWGAENLSNNITLTVYDVEESSAAARAATTSSGARTLECIEQWFCTFWSVCYPEGYMERKCKDLSSCGTEYYKPLEKQNCTYIPSCFNGKKDGDETRIDCGGKCGPCPTCSDGTMNYDETGIDCGGSCPPCPTCSDGIINGGEVGIDCGGACPLQDCCMNGYRDGHLNEIGIDCGGNCGDCKVEMEKFAPQRLILTAIALLVSLALAALLIYLNLGRIKSLFFLTISQLRKKRIAPAKKAEALIFSKLDRLEKEIESKSAEAALKEFSTALKEILIRIFKISYEFTYQDVNSIISQSKLNSVIKSIFIGYITRIIHVSYSEYKISKEEVILLAKELRILLSLIKRSVKIESGLVKPIEENKEYQFRLDKLYATLSQSLSMLVNIKIEKAKELLQSSKEMYKTLSKDEKKEADNYITRIRKEVEMFDRKTRRAMRAKTLSVSAISLIAILFISNMGLFPEANITGFHLLGGASTFEDNNAQFLVDMGNLNIEVGERLVYRIKGYDKEEEKLFFSDDTSLFNISSEGVIDFTPKEGMVGIHHVTLIIKNSNFKTFFKDIIFNITKDGKGIEPESEIETDQIAEQNQTAEKTSIDKEATTPAAEEVNLTKDMVNVTDEETNITKETTKPAAEEINLTKDMVNITNEETNLTELTEETANITNKRMITNKSNETNETPSDKPGIEEEATGLEAISKQQSENLTLRPLDAYVSEFHLGGIAEFNLLVENEGSSEIKDAYFSILVEDNKGPKIIEAQSTTITLAGREKREMVAHWDSKNVTTGKYNGKLKLIYENKLSEHGIILSIEENEIKAEIIGVTGMVAAPSAILRTQYYTDVPPALMWVILIIISADIAWFLYCQNKKRK